MNFAALPATLVAPNIAAAIEALWREADVTPRDFPTVAPLWAFIDARNVSCIELPNLTMGAVARHLQRGGRSLDVECAHTPLAGFLYAESLDAFLFVKANDPVARRRFSAAHELGHLVLHCHPELAVFCDGLSFALSPDEEAHQNAAGESALTRREGDWDDKVSARLADFERMEREANAFAAHLLMPEETCHRLWELHSARFGARPGLLARRLATDLLVSPLAMKIRLGELGLMPR